MWETIKQSIYEGAGSGLFYVCFVLLFMMDRDKKLRYKITYPNFLLMLLFMNPWVFEHVWLKLMPIQTHRMLICIPTTFIIAFVISAFWSQTKKWDTVFAGILIVILMILCYDDRNEQLMPAENLYGIPQDVIEVCDFVLEEVESPILVVSDPDANYFRQYSSEIRLLFGDDIVGDKMGGAKEIPQDYYAMSDLLDDEIIRIDNLVDYANNYGVDYIVINMEEYPAIELLYTTWYGLHTTIGRYMIFKHV